MKAKLSTAQQDAFLRIVAAEARCNPAAATLRPTTLVMALYAVSVLDWEPAQACRSFAGGDPCVQAALSEAIDQFDIAECKTCLEQAA